MGSPASVILFTGSYPYEAEAEHMFLDPEIGALCSNFDRVIIVPRVLAGDKRTVPAGVEVEESHALTQPVNLRRKSTIWSVVRSTLFWKEPLARPRTFVQPRALKSLMGLIASADRTRKWVCDFIVRNNIDVSRSVFYTYWLDRVTSGIGLAKHQYPQLKLVSRAHGYDLYEHRHNPPYIPYRSQCLSRVDRLFLISEDGKNYISNRYPWFAPSCEVSRLGVNPPGFIASRSKDGVFRIASCSFIVSIKRLDLLLRGIQHLALSRPRQNFEWHHIGDGPLSDYIQSLAQQVPTNLKCNFWGHLPNEEVMSFYRDNPVDLFVNASETEGISVSIMEVQSCGIPVVATAVGGTPEIVSDQNGRLVSKSPTPREIAEAIWSILEDHELAMEKRKASQQMWQDRYNADVNSRAFAKRMRSLIDQR